MGFRNIFTNDKNYVRSMRGLRKTRRSLGKQAGRMRAMRMGKKVF